MINHFISFPTQLTQTILLRIIGFCFNIFTPYGFVLCYSKKRFSFPFEIYLWLPCPCLLAGNVDSLFLKISIHLFSSHFCFLGFVVLLFIFMLPMLLLAVVINPSLLFLIQPSSPYMDAPMESSILASSSSFFDACNLCYCKALCIIISFLVLWFNCLCSLCILRSWVSYKGNCPGVYTFDMISVEKNGFKKLSRTSEEFFSFVFLSSPLAWCCPLPIFQSKSKFHSIKEF